MYARKNLLKEKVARGEVVFGTEVYLRDPRVVEIMGAAGFDFMHIENEHVAHNWETVEDLVRAAELWGMTPMFRCEQTVDGQPPVNQILKALKCGCLNVMVPHVGTAETAQKIVDIVKFPPYASNETLQVLSGASPPWTARRCRCSRIWARRRWTFPPLKRSSTGRP